jgi:hypothetical protein
MIQNDAAILEHFIENWGKVLDDWVDENIDKMTARNIMNYRKVDESVQIDVVQTIDRTGLTAQITAKGAVPKSMGSKVTNEKYEIYQISTMFNLSKKDLGSSPSMKDRMIEMCIDDVHRAEDDLALNGNSAHNIPGIVTAARANSNGKITQAASSGINTGNKGKWTGEASTDIYDDVNTAIGKLGSNYKPSFLVGNSKDIRLLYKMDSERQQYFKTMSILFGKKDPDDVSWIWETDFLPQNYVYIVCKNTRVADFVVSENPDVTAYPLAPGKNYPVEIGGWSVPEIYDNDGFVEIQIT